MDQDQFINVKYFNGDELITSKELEWPQEYNNFIQDIIKKFDLSENTEITLRLITQEEDDIKIQSQKALEKYVSDNNIKEFNFFAERRKESEDVCSTNELQKLLEKSVIDDEKIDIDIDDIMKDLIDDEEYQNKIKNDAINYSNIFKQNLEKNVDDILKKNLESIKGEINTKISNVYKSSLSLYKESFNSVLAMKDDISDIKEGTDDMSNAINDLLEGVQNKSVIIRYQDPTKPEPEPEEDIISIEFENKNIEQPIDIKEAKSFSINNIKIINQGNKSLKNLVFYKDNNKTSEDIHFSGTANDNIFELPGELKPKTKAAFNLKLTIDNPKPNEDYKMVIHIKEKNKDKNLCDPCNLILKVKQAEDPNKKKLQQANEIYEQIKNEFKENINLIDKNEIISRLMQNNLNGNEIRKALKAKIDEIQKAKNDEKLEQLYNELNFFGFDFKKEDVIDKIKEHNFNTQNVQNWIDELISNQIYNNLQQSNDVDFKTKSREEVIAKIKELNFDEDNIKKEFRKDTQPIPKELEEIYQWLVDNYGIDGIKDEEEVKQKIIELNCDKNACIEWVEQILG